MAKALSSKAKKRWANDSAVKSDETLTKKRVRANHPGCGLWGDTRWRDFKIKQRLPLVPKMWEQMIFSMPPFGGSPRVAYVVAGSSVCKIHRGVSRYRYGLVRCICRATGTSGEAAGTSMPACMLQRRFECSERSWIWSMLHHRGVLSYSRLCQPIFSLQRCWLLGEAWMQQNCTLPSFCPPWNPMDMWSLETMCGFPKPLTIEMDGANSV